ncbi:Bardet-Biedl syndrome 7-like protein [Armadillidium nasatum]|uniref:Bardet-Biedl syndrome 7-like protein n=1 Tax=Armadillidium nasatum TaxID=96803 RepID=A0A5N5SNQ3_9CRUS|nr:Bardet-Biedl syndrome 7-like protein [Armadillidium nasatum]
MKKGEVQLGFRTLPGKSITRIELGGALGTVKDKIFVSSGNEVRGFTKKGKQFLGFDTNLTDDIKSMFISGSDLLVCGDYVYNHYCDCQDTNYYLAADKINDVIALPAEKVRTMGQFTKMIDQSARPPIFIKIIRHHRARESDRNGCGSKGLLILINSETVGPTTNIYKNRSTLSYYLPTNRTGPDMVQRMKSLVPILACEDRLLRVMRDSDILYSVELPAPPTTLQLFYNDGGEYGDQLLYGTSDGKIGLVQLSRWVCEPTEGNSRANVGMGSQNGAVTSMDHHDMTGDGIKDLIIGREGGSIQIYAYEDGDEAEPTLRFTQAISETVTAVQGGVVGNSGYDEVLASSYTGWVFGLTSEPMDRNVSSESGVVSISQESREKIQRLRQEIDELQDRVLVERERYQSATQSAFPGISAVPFFSVHDKMTLSRSDASYLLTLEVQTAIDNVLLQSDVPVDLLDVERNSAVVSYSTCDPESGNYLLATYRCQANTTRLEVRIRTIEGQYGMLQAYITPRLQPKCCQVRQYRIKPLSLHSRIHNFDSNRPYNVLTLKGQFSLPEMHSWIVFCLPEVPERTPAGDSVELSFISTFLDTQLQCCYEASEAVFKSDNISTISILKDVITKEATKKKAKLEISCEVSEESIDHALYLLHPRLEAQLLLAKQVSLIEPLRELSSQESDSSFLSPEYQFILDHADDLQLQYRKQPCHLERLYDICIQERSRANQYPNNEDKFPTNERKPE